MDDPMSRELLQEVVFALEQAGYNPYNQLKGYYQTGSTTYITRAYGARDLISKVHPEHIKEYLDAFSGKCTDDE